MIESPVSRRAVVAGGFLGAATLSGCSLSSLTGRKVIDPQAADRARVSRAVELSRQILADIGPETDASSVWATAPRALHAEQVDVLVRSAGLRIATPRGSASPTPTPLVQATLPARERALSQEFRTLALAAEAGDVAMLLASGVAGIDQLLAKGF